MKTQLGEGGVVVTGFWQVFELLGHLGFATVLTVWPNDFGRHPRLIRAIGILGLITGAPRVLRFGLAI
jgi:hypothetical protein